MKQQKMQIHVHNILQCCWSTSQVGYNILPPSLMHCNDANLNSAHALPTWVSHWQWNVSQGPIYCNYKLTRTRTKIHKHDTPYCPFLSSANSPSTPSPFIWQHHHAWPQGAPPLLHKHILIVTGVNTSIYPSLQPQTPLLFDLSHPSLCLIPVSPLASTKWNANRPA